MLQKVSLLFTVLYWLWDVSLGDHLSLLTLSEPDQSEHSILTYDTSLHGSAMCNIFPFCKHVVIAVTAAWSCYSYQCESEKRMIDLFHFNKQNCCRRANVHTARQLVKRREMLRIKSLSSLRWTSVEYDFGLLFCAHLRLWSISHLKHLQGRKLLHSIIWFTALVVFLIN